jgi:CarD family transcriptional regulator
MKFAIGDLIVYGETGVCRVEDILEKELLDGPKECYKLMPYYSSCAIFTPTDNGNVFVRPVVTRDEAENLVGLFRTVDPEIKTASSPRELSEKYDKIIKLHDCNALVDLVVSIHKKRDTLIAQKKKLSAIDERFLKKAEDLLFGELAAALDIKKTDVREYIESK